MWPHACARCSPHCSAEYPAASGCPQKDAADAARRSGASAPSLPPVPVEGGNTPRNAIAPRSGTAEPPAAGACGQSSLGARIVDTTERAGQKIVLHCQLADLGMQVLDAGAVHGFALCRRYEQIRGAFL